jgi:sporulation protein YlmC with PRC-barrel domain
MAFGCALAMIAAPAAADQSQARDRGVNTAQTAPSPTGRSAVPVDAVRKYEDARASRLVGMFVRNAKNEEMGQVKDLIIDLDKSRVAYALLEVDGRIFVSQKVFAVPFSAFKPSADGERLILGVERAKLAAGPAFEPERLSDWQARYSKQIDDYFGLSRDADEKANRRFVRATRSLGKDVHDAGGKEIGELADYVVNVKNGGIRYAVLAFDKRLSSEEKLVAVPLRGFDVAEKDQLRVNISRDVIAKTQSVSRSEWRRAHLAQDPWIGKSDLEALAVVSPR